MMKSPLLKLIFQISSWLAAVAALYLGILVFRGGQHVLHNWALGMNMPWLSTIIHVVFGVAGILALINLLMDLMD